MKKKAIVVEDDEGIRDSLKLILESYDFEVKVFADGKQLLTNDPDTADIYLIDKQLIGIDGLSICRHLKSLASTSDIPIIILSATPNIHHLVKLSGADAFLEKPYSKKTLINTINTVIQGVSEKNNLP